MLLLFTFFHPQRFCDLTLRHRHYGLFGTVNVKDKGTASDMIRSCCWDEMRAGSDDFALKESLVFTEFHQKQQRRQQLSAQTGSVTVFRFLSWWCQTAFSPRGGGEVGKGASFSLPAPPPAFTCQRSSWCRRNRRWGRGWRRWRFSCARADIWISVRKFCSRRNNCFLRRLWLFKHH